MVDIANPETQNGDSDQNDKVYQPVPMITKPHVEDDDKEPTAEELRERAMDELKKNLLFDQKDISIWRLYCHLSTTMDVICMVIAAIGSLGAGISMPIIAFLSGDMFSSVGDSSSFQNMTNPIFLKIMHDTLEKVMMTQVRRFLYIGIGMFAAHFINVAFWTFVGLRQVHQLKENYFNIILQQEQGWFDAHNAFEFATKVQAQLEQVELGAGERFGNVLMMISQMISGLIIAMTTSWKLTLTMISLSPLIIITIIYLVTALKKGIIMGRKTYEKAGGIAEEMLYNIKTVASFANFDFEKNRFNAKIDLVYQLDLGTTIRLGGSIGFLLFFMYCTFVVAFCYGRLLIIDKEVNNNTGRVFKGGDVVTVIFSTIMAIMSVGMVAPNLKIIQEACIATSDYFTLVEREPQIDLSTSTLKPHRDTVKGKIEFKNIMFSYPSDPNKRVILNNLNLVFEPGKKVALVGESGCGKSTTVNLIERLYESTGGEVLIDGINIKDYDVNYLRSLIGYVQQEPVLFNRSISDNLTFGREEEIKKLGDTETLIKEACDDAYATEFISLLPDKFNYFVGIKGSKLSGGQKQRLAIARAILCKPKILILDEATSALDNKSEKEVQRALDHISQKNVTTVIIAHRLSTIKNADLIYAIKGGSVIEQGTHKELLEKKGYYAGLVKSQLAQDELESKEDNLEMPVKGGRKSTMNRSSSMNNSIQNIKSTKVALSADDIKVSKARLFHELRNNKLDIFLATLGAAAVGSLQPVFGFMMARSMNALNSNDMDIVDKDGLFFGLMYLLIAFLNGLFNFFMAWKYTTLGVTLAMIFRKKILAKYLTLHIAFFDLNENAPGALLTRLSIDTMQLNSIILSLIGSTVNVSCVVIVGLAMGFSYDWRLTLIVICFIPFIAFSIFIRTSLRRGGNRKGIKANIEAGSILSECVVNTKTIYSFNFQKKAVSMYLDALFYIKQEFTRDSFLNGFFLGLGQFAVFAANATVFYCSKIFLQENSITSQNMALSINIIMMCAGGVGNGLAQAGDYRKAVLAFKSLYSTLDTATLIDPSDEYNADKKSANEVKGKIEFKDVTFAYPTRPDQIILKKINFTILPGQAAALVGYSGCGKSTIIQLLERFYDVEEGKGEILIDDVNIKDYNLLELRRKIGLVSQEPVLFKRSVMENVRYGKLDSTDEEVIKAAGDANIMKFFTADKMHQIIGHDAEMDKKKGKKDKEKEKDDGKVGKKEDPVSGGEKQRLAIARAFLKDPKILLLDEATSALDKDSEVLVQKSLDKLAGGRTSVTIAHRLSTIEHCNTIFVLEAGRIVEQGTHEHLMSLQQKYYTLHKYSDMN